MQIFLTFTLLFFSIFFYNINILHFTPSLCRGCEPTATFTRTHPQQSYIYTSAVFSTVRAMLLKEIPYNIFLFCQTVVTLRHSPRVLLMPKDFLSFQILFIYLQFCRLLIHGYKAPGIFSTLSFIFQNNKLALLMHTWNSTWFYS